MSSSGCIFGTCPVCKELVWEGENWDISETGKHIHSKCRHKRTPVGKVQFLIEQMSEEEKDEVRLFVSEWLK